MNYDKLFKHLYDEHGLTLTESELQEIVNSFQGRHEDTCPCCGTGNTYRTIAVKCNRCSEITELDCMPVVEASIKHQVNSNKLYCWMFKDGKLSEKFDELDFKLIDKKQFGEAKTMGYKLFELKEYNDITLDFLPNPCKHRRQTVDKSGDLVCLECGKVIYKST